MTTKSSDAASPPDPANLIGPALREAVESLTRAELLRLVKQALEELSRTGYCVRMGQHGQCIEHHCLTLYRKD